MRIAVCDEWWIRERSEEKQRRRARDEGGIKTAQQTQEFRFSAEASTSYTNDDGERDFEAVVWP